MRRALSLIVQIAGLAVIGLAALLMWRTPARRARERRAEPAAPGTHFADTQPLVHDSDDWYLMPGRTGSDR